MVSIKKPVTLGRDRSKCLSLKSSIWLSILGVSAIGYTGIILFMNYYFNYGCGYSGFRILKGSVAESKT